MGVHGEGRREEIEMIRYSLVGYDGSEASRRAFQFAIDLARCAGGRVRVVWVLQVSEGGADACALMMADSGTQRAQELLGELVAIEPDAAKMVDIELIHGSPGDVLLSQVDEHGVDHIVIGMGGGADTGVTGACRRCAGATMERSCAPARDNHVQGNESPFICPAPTRRKACRRLPRRVRRP